jgi:hypothetical protein
MRQVAGQDGANLGSFAQSHESPSSVLAVGIIELWGIDPEEPDSCAADFDGVAVDYPAAPDEGSLCRWNGTRCTYVGSRRPLHPPHKTRLRWPSILSAFSWPFEERADQ